MKIKTLRALKTEDLKTKLKELRELKVKLETERKYKKVLEKPSELKNVKRNIARILTILNERKRMPKE